MCESDVQWNRDSNGPLKVPRQTDGVRVTKKRSIESQASVESSSHTSASSSTCSIAPTTSSCSSPLEQQYIPFSMTKSPLLNQIQLHVQEYFRAERALYTMLYPERCTENDIAVNSKISILNIIFSFTQ